MHGLGTQVPDCQSWASVFLQPPSGVFPYRELFEAFGTSPIGIAICDRRLRFVAVNRTLAKINKIPANEHPGRFVSDVVGNLGPTISNRLMNVFGTARPVHNAELKGQLAANPQSGHWIENMFPIRDDRKRVMQVGVFVLSIAGLRLGEDVAAQASGRINSEVEYGTGGVQSDLQCLSPREIDVLRLLANGRSTKEAAASLGISAKTAETYRTRLMLRLHAHSLADVVHFAIRHGLVELKA
jgi:DNA-binding CsgD family transcriptional regulator